MVNPILATIIKKAIKGSMKSQTGGGTDNEKNVMTFLALIIVVIIIEFVACDTIARQKVDKILESSPSVTTGGPRSGTGTGTGTGTGVLPPPTTSVDPGTAGQDALDEASQLADVSQDVTTSPNIVTQGARSPAGTGAAGAAAAAAAAGTTGAGAGAGNVTTGAGNVTTSADDVVQAFTNTKNRVLTKEQLKKYRKAVNEEIYVPLLFINILVMFGLFKWFKKGDNNNVKNLFAISFSVMISSMLISYMIKVKKTDKVIFFSEYIGVSGFTGKQIGIGMMTNIIFGFIDNFGLFFGMDSLDDFLNFKQNRMNQYGSIF